MSTPAGIRRLRRLVFSTRPWPPAVRAGLADDPTLALAGGTADDVDNLAEDRLGRPADLSAAAAGAAALYRGARVGAIPGAPGADHQPRYLDVPLDALVRLFEVDGEVVAEVGTAHVAGLAAARETAAEEGVEDVSEAEPLKTFKPSRPGAHTRVPEHVVGAAAIGVGQDLVGLRGLLEAGLGLGIIRIPIRVKLHGELPEGAFELLRRAVPGYPENLVIVPLNRQRGAPLGPMRAGRPGHEGDIPCGSR